MFVSRTRRTNSRHSFVGEAGDLFFTEVGILLLNLAYGASQNFTSASLFNER